MNNPAMKKLTDTVNDLKKRVDILSGKKHTCESCEKIIARDAEDYQHVRNLYMRIVGHSDAISIERMCHYMQEEYESLLNKLENRKYEKDIDSMF